MSKARFLSPGLLIALMTEAARTSETLVNFYQTTRCYNPEDSNLLTHRRENLKSYFLLLFIYLRLNLPIRKFSNFSTPPLIFSILFLYLTAFYQLQSLYSRKKNYVM
jgi:hypothetical protein